MTADCRDIKRQFRRHAVGNMLVRKFWFPPPGAKISLVKSYCYPIYGCALRRNSYQNTVRKFTVSNSGTFKRFILLESIYPYTAIRSTIFVNHSCMSSTFIVAILDGICFFTLWNNEKFETQRYLTNSTNITYVLHTMFIPLQKKMKYLQDLIFKLLFKQNPSCLCYAFKASKKIYLFNIHQHWHNDALNQSGDFITMSLSANIALYTAGLFVVTAYKLYVYYPYNWTSVDQQVTSCGVAYPLVLLWISDTVDLNRN